jgi:hypothetical protein
MALLEVFKLPLTEKVRFKARLQRGNRLQVLKYARWRFKLEADQYLQATVSVVGALYYPQTFLTRITKDGRIVIPKMIISLIQARKLNLTGCIMEITLEPF